MHRPLKIGLTGGIGTGKTVVSKIFAALGVPVLYADDVAKQLMNTDHSLIQSIKNKFGNHLYNNGRLDTKALSDIVFRDTQKLNQLNNLVHPAVARYGQEWINKQNSDYIIKEAAILIESGAYKDMDLIIGVDAPIHLRLKRTMQRDHISEQEVLERMNKQMDNNQKMQFCDFIVQNDDKNSLIEQCLKIHDVILSKISNNDESV